MSAASPRADLVAQAEALRPALRAYVAASARLVPPGAAVVVQHGDERLHLSTTEPAALAPLLADALLGTLDAEYRAARGLGDVPPLLQGG